MVLLAAGCLPSYSGGNVEVGIVAADTVTPQSLKQNNSGGSSGDQVVGINVIVTEIDIRVNGVKTPISTQRTTLDLLALDHKVFTSLGVTKLPQGHLDHLELKLDEVGDYVVLANGDHKPLETPADGDVDVKGKLDLDSCASGIIILDFDPGLKSEDEGSRKEWELKPTARIKTEEIAGACGSDGGGGGQPDMCHGGGSPDMSSTSCVGVICPAGEMCVNGQCVASNSCQGVICPPGQTCMNGVCM
jgi:hypothetical protein